MRMIQICMVRFRTGDFAVVLPICLHMSVSSLLLIHGEANMMVVDSTPIASEDGYRLHENVPSVEEMYSSPRSSTSDPPPSLRS